MSKTAWVTSLPKDEELVQRLTVQLNDYGIESAGHFWTDDLNKLAWAAPVPKVVDSDLWIVLSDDETIASPTVRLGLSFAALSVQALKGHGFSIGIVHRGASPDPETLPTPLRGATVLDADGAALQAQLTALAHSPAPKIESEYRLDLHPLPNGVLFEIGPTGEPWKGTLFGVTGADEKSADLGAQAVGPTGTAPEKATLEYPSTGIKLTLGEKEYVACSVQNVVGGETSYYALVQGKPEAVLFGPYPDSEDTEPELYVIKLQ